MKNYYIYLCTLFIAFSSCKDMSSEYKEFIIPNGYVYPQKADSLTVYPGFNKLRLKWLKPKSPTVDYAMVYWNNFSDSLKVEWQSDQDTIMVDIDDLDENSYTVYIKNFDKQGNVSLPSEITGTPYGNNYLISATDRSYTSALRNASGLGTINWGVKTPDLIYTEVRYLTNNGSEKKLKINFDDNLLTLPDIKIGEHFEYRSVFLPNNGIDSVVRDWQTSEKPFLYKYPTASWIVEARGGHHDWGDGGGGQPELLFDSDFLTGWHSKVGTEMPQVIVADMREELSIDNIIIYPPSQVNWRYLNEVEIYISEKPIAAEEPNESWGDPVVKAVYNGEDSFEINLGKEVKGKYLAVVFLDSKSNTYISCMEIEAYGL